MKIFSFLSIILVLLLAGVAGAHLSGDHNIDTNREGYHWAWNDIIGWINFHANDTVEVRANELRGYAQSSLGPIVFNCATTPGGDICDDSNGHFRVENKKGDLSGWAWNDVAGWISFDCADINACGRSSYRVSIEPAGDGENSFFEGWAWSEIIGWISFTCENDHDPNLAGTQSVCSNFPTYRIQTNVGARSITGILESNVFDTGRDQPAFNYVLWQGNLKTDTIVELKLAFSTSSDGPWNFNDVGSLLPGQIKKISPIEGKRYVRYQVLISSDNWQESTPVIDDIIINWSP